jgi:hypothetical protein
MAFCHQDRMPDMVKGFEEICASELISVFVPFNFVHIREFSTHIQFIFGLSLGAQTNFPAPKHLKNLFTCVTPALAILGASKVWQLI